MFEAERDTAGGPKAEEASADNMANQDWTSAPERQTEDTSNGRALKLWLAHNARKRGAIYTGTYGRHNRQMETEPPEGTSRKL